LPDISSNEEDDDQEKGEDDESEAIVGPRLYSDPDEEKEEEVEIQPTIINSEMARCRADFGSEGPLFVRLPNFLSVDTKPFNPEAYEDEVEEDDEEGKSRLKLKIENTIRWRTRTDDQGNEVRESNAKIVRWSDGSMSLYLGNEIFDIERHKIMNFNHLFVRQGQALQAQAIMSEKLKFRPHSTDTLTHRKVTLSMADKTNRIQKVKVIASLGDNPETQKQELIRQEEEKLKAIARREANQRRIRDRPRQSGLTSGFIEGDDSDEGESLSAIKRRYQQGAVTQEYSSESEEDTRDIERAKSVAEAKLISSGEDSDNEEVQKQKQKKKIVINDSDDDE